MKSNVYLMKQNDDDYYIRLLNSEEMKERRDMRRLRAKRFRTALSIAKTVLTVIITLAVVGIYRSIC